MTRIGIVISDLDVGGAETLVVGLAGQFRARGHHTVIFSLASNGPLSDAASSTGAEVISLGVGRADPRAVGALIGALRASSVDLLHLHLPRAGVLGRLAARRLGLRPVVYTEHNISSGYGAVIRRLNAWTLGWTDHIVTVSEEIRRRILAQGIRASGVTTIRNGIDVDALSRAAEQGVSPRALLGLSPGTPLIGTVANLHPRKGLDVLVAAVARLRQLWPDLQAAVVGRDDGIESQLRDQAASAGVDRAVHFLGSRRDVPAFLRGLDMFVLPSRAEGLPVALLEAMALGLPAVVTPVGGVPEAVADEREGLHVPVGSAEALARAVDRLLRAPAEAAALGAQAAVRVRAEFSLNRVADDHLRLYAGLAGGRRMA